MTHREQPELRNGAGDAISASFELIATPVIFGLLGWFIDSKLGVFPLFTLGLATLALAYGVWKIYSVYVASMNVLLEERRSHYSDGAINA